MNELAFINQSPRFEISVVQIRSARDEPKETAEVSISITSLVSETGGRSKTYLSSAGFNFRPLSLLLYLSIRIDFVMKVQNRVYNHVPNQYRPLKKNLFNQRPE